LIIDTFTDQRKEIIKKLRKVPGQFSLTSDIWTSVNREAFLGLTVHYIDSDWNLCNFLLDIIPFANKHTGANIAKEIMRVLEEFNISTKIIGLTTDNDSAMLACGKEIADIFDNEVSLMNFSYYRCAAHVLNLGVKKGLTTVDNSVMKARKLTNMIRNSTNLTNSLRRFCTVKNMKFLKPIQDIDIRWNSTFYMLQRFKALEPALALLATDERSISALYPDEEDWNSIRVN
jgi:zinc finger BED domain-containing protein 1 (E3 SUMO-protein ligase ZBED1)